MLKRLPSSCLCRQRTYVISPAKIKLKHVRNDMLFRQQYYHKIMEIPLITRPSNNTFRDKEIAARQHQGANCELDCPKNYQPLYLLVFRLILRPFYTNAPKKECLVFRVHCTCIYVCLLLSPITSKRNVITSQPIQMIEMSLSKSIRTKSTIIHRFST